MRLGHESYLIKTPRFGGQKHVIPKNTGLPGSIVPWPLAPKNASQTSLNIYKQESTSPLPPKIKTNIQTYIQTYKQTNKQKTTKKHYFSKKKKKKSRSKRPKARRLRQKGGGHGQEDEAQQILEGQGAA